MSSFAKWWARLAAVVGAVSMSVFIPVAAWASTGPGAVVVEAARGRRRVSGFGLIGTLCCLAVVVIIVFVLLLLMRNRRPPRPPR
jgi:Na+/melibiose symporter-like transporter